MTACGTTRASPAAVAQVLRDIASALKLAKEGKFRIAAYERAADAIESFSGDLGRWVAEGRLTDLPGVGDKIAAVIAEVVETGTSRQLGRLARELPPGALALARGPKLSLRAIRTLSDAGIRDLTTLRDAAEHGKLQGLRGFTAKTEARIVSEMKQDEARRGKTILRDAIDIAASVARFLGGEVETAGEVRRGLEIVDRVALLATTDDPPATLARMERYPRVIAVEAKDADSVCVRLADGDRVELHVTRPSSRAFALMRATGPAAHVAAFEAAADRAGFHPRRAKDVAGEPELYARAHLQWVPPELRDDTEGAGSIAAAARGGIPRLVEVGDIRGMVHCHTDYSDGRHTIEQMARAAEERGMQFITITDHSPTAHYAGGVEIERLRRQWDEIARVQEKVKIRILRGTESDILKDGALDYPDAILEQLDVIVASIHNRYALDEPAMTRRILRAIRNPFFKIWGHPLGRILLHRAPVACDIERILDEAAESRVAIEINGDPYRMDLEPRWVRLARERGIPFVVSVDAHSMRELDNVRWGIVLARRGGLRTEQVLNTRDVDAFVAAVRPGAPSARGRVRRAPRPPRSPRPPRAAARARP